MVKKYLFFEKIGRFRAQLDSLFNQILMLTKLALATTLATLAEIYYWPHKEAFSKLGWALFLEDNNKYTFALQLFHYWYVGVSPTVIKKGRPAIFCQILNVTVRKRDKYLLLEKQPRGYWEISFCVQQLNRVIVVLLWIIVWRFYYCYIICYICHILLCYVCF